MSELGDNVAAALKGFVERIENIESEREALREDIKDEWAKLKSAGLPVKGLKKLHGQLKKDPEKEAEARSELTDAAALLGVAAYVGEVIDDGTDPFPKAKQEAATNGIASIKRLEEELTSLGEDRKALNKEIKSTGLSVEIIEKVIVIKNDPDGFNEQSLLVDTYRRALSI